MQTKKQNPLDHTNTQSRNKNKETDNTTITITQRREQWRNWAEVFTTTTTTTTTEKERRERGFNIRIATRERESERARERAEAKWTRYFGKFRKKLTPEEQVNIERKNTTHHKCVCVVVTDACMTARECWHHCQAKRTIQVHVTWARVWRRKQC